MKPTKTHEKFKYDTIKRFNEKTEYFNKIKDIHTKKIIT